ncbi:MAG: nucleoside phosphorylase [Clostridia bacterium]|nr:nucleoside phosphorylase [Clostridia bacterium]
MSIIHSFDPHSEAVLNPWDVIVPVENLPGTLIATFNPKFIAILEKMASLEECAVLKANGRAIPVYRFEYHGAVLGIFHTMLGGAASAAMLEELIAMGAKRVLYFGSAGALDRELVEGHLIVPTAAYRDEGVSYHYMPASDSIEIDTAETLCAILDSLNVSYAKAKTWTTDAVYRETRANMEKRKAEGCAVVEMECASVMAVGQFRKIPVYQFLYAADCLDATQWDRRLLGSMPQDMRERILTVALNIAARLN